MLVIDNYNDDYNMNHMNYYFFDYIDNHFKMHMDIFLQYPIKESSRKSRIYITLE